MSGIDVARKILKKSDPKAVAERYILDKGGIPSWYMVDLKKRPVIDGKKLQEAGWGEQPEGSKATVFTSGYSNADGTETVLLTPILDDGTVLTPDELEECAVDILNKNRVDKRVLVGTYRGEDSVKQANEAAQKIHEDQAKYLTLYEENGDDTYSGKRLDPSKAMANNIKKNNEELEDVRQKGMFLPYYLGSKIVDTTKKQEKNNEEKDNEKTQNKQEDDAVSTDYLKDEKIKIQGVSDELSEELKNLYLDYRFLKEDFNSGKISASDYSNGIAQLKTDHKKAYDDYFKETNGKNLEIPKLGEMFNEAVNTAEKNQKENKYYDTLKSYYDSAQNNDFEEYTKDNNGNETENKVEKYFKLKEMSDRNASVSDYAKMGIVGLSKSDDATDIDNQYIDPQSQQSQYIYGINGNARYLYMTDQERKIYKYQLNKYGEKEADNFLKHLESTLDKRHMDAFSQKTKAEAKEHPVLGVAADVLSSLQTGQGFADTVSQAIGQSKEGDEYTPYNPYKGVYAPVYLKNAAREGITEDMPTWGKVATDIGLSVAENAARLPLGNVGGLVTMGANVAGETAVSKGASGETDAGKATLTGLVNGGVEIATEKIPLDNIFKVLDAPPSTVKEAATTLAKNMLTEASEEAISNVADNIADSVINGDKSEYEQYKKQLMDNGATESEATKQAFLKFYVSDTAISAAEGGISGGIMNIGSMAVGAAINRNEVSKIGKEIKSSDAQQSVIDTGLESNENSEAYKNAVKLQSKQESGKTVTNYDVGKQYLSNIAEINRENTQNTSKNTSNNTVIENTSRQDTNANMQGNEINENNNTVDEKKTGEVSNNLAQSSDITSENKLLSTYNTAQQTRDVQAPARNVRNASADTVQNAAGQQATAMQTGNQSSLSDVRNVVADTADDTGVRGATATNVTMLDTSDNAEIAVSYNERLSQAAGNVNVQSQTNINSVAALTKSVSETMAGTRVGLPTDTSHIQETNAAFQAEADNVFDREFVNRYAEDFVSSMANKNGNAYKKLSSLTDNLTGELTSYVLTGQSALSSDASFQVTANAFKTVLTDAVNKNAILHSRTYGSSDILNEQVNAVRNGDFSVLDVNKYGFRDVAAEDKVPGLLQDEYSDALTQEERTAIDALATATGVTVKIVPAIRKSNGCYKDGVIYISLDAQDKVMTVFSHEITHAVANANSYEEYKNAALKIIQKDSNTSLDTLVNDKIQAYAASDIDLTAQEAEEELVADFTQKILTDTDKAMEFADSIENPQTKKGVLRTIIDAIKNLIGKIKGIFSEKTAKMQELQRTSDLFEQALKDKAVGNVREDSDVTKHLPIKTNSKGKYVQADRQVISGDNPDEWGNQIYNYINDEIRNGRDVVIPTDDGDNLTISEKTAWKLEYRNEARNSDGTSRYMTDDEYKVKLNAAAHIDELAKISTRGKKNVADRKNHNFAQNGFNYRTAYFRDLDGQYYKLTISVGENNDGKIVYNIGQIKRVPFPAFSGSKTSDNVTSAKRNSSTDIISNPEKNVKHSLKENTSNQQTNFAQKNNGVPNQTDMSDMGYNDSVEKSVSNSEPLVKKPIKESTDKTAEHKAKQLEIIKEYNSADDDYHTWIRNEDDIKTFSETLLDTDYEEGEDFAPDYTWNMAQKAIKSGEMTVYSSYPIKQGVFVTPSRMEAESYAGSGQIYEKKVKLSDVAWIDPTQGMYAEVKETRKTKFSAKESTGNQQTKSDTNTQEGNGNDAIQGDSSNVLNEQDVKDMQSIGRKSVNDFSSEDIEKTKTVAKKYYAEIGNKSPFFRSWFGDWRSSDTTPVHIVTEKDNARGVKVNKDTGWDIQISGKVFNETKIHQSSSTKNATGYLNYINSIVENAILLDSYTIPSKRKKSENSVMMHSLYAIADMGNGNELIKLYVEELNNINTDGTIKRAYQLQNISKAPVASVRVQGKSFSSLTNTTGADTYTVSDLFNLVKQYDKNFKPKQVSKVVNEDGTPKVVYHQTDADFSVFSTANESAGKTDEILPTGSFFKSTDSDIGLSGKKQMSVYLDIKNPLRLADRAAAEKYWRNNIDGYSEIIDNLKRIDSEYRTKFLEESNSEKESYTKLWNDWKNGKITEEEYQDSINRDPLESILAEWNEKSDAARLKAKELINKYMAHSNFDGIILDKDSGSFGRTTDTYIVFNSNQIKSATDNVGTFDKNNPDIRFSTSRNAGSATAYKVSQEIINDFGAKSRVKAQDISGQIADIASKVYNTYYEKGDVETKYAELEKSARSVAETVADGMRNTSDFSKEAYDTLRKEIKSTKIKVTEADKADFADWNDFRKRNFGYLTLSQDGTSIDSLYKELTETHPDLFDEYENMTTGDQLRDIVDTLSSMKPQEYALSSEEYNNAVTDITNEIITKAVNLAGDMGYLDDEGNIRDDRIYSEQDMKNALAEQKRQLDEKTREKLKEQREKVRKQIMDKVNASKEKAKLRKQESEDRTKLLKLAREINSMKLSPENKEKILDIVKNIDTVSKGMIKDGYTTKDGRRVMGILDLQELKASYDKLKNDENFLPDKNIEAKISRLDKMQIADMEISDVRELVQTLQEVKHEIQTGNKLLNDARNKEIAIAASESTKEIERAKRLSKWYKNSKVNDYVQTQLSPYSMARRITGYAKNSTFETLVDDLNEGQRKSMMFRQEASSRFDDLVSKADEMKKLTGKKTELIDISKYDPEGRKVYISPAMRVSLYLHSMNYGNLKHIQYGGITVPNMNDFNKGNIQAAYESDGVTIRLSPSQVKAITSEMTPFEKQIADAAYKFFNEDCKKAVNEASLLLNGYEKANVKDYFPIVSNKNFVMGDFESLVKNGTLEGKGMLQERKYAGNPIVLEDVTKVIARHMNDVGDYSGLAVPIRNFNKVWNAIGKNYGYSTKQAINENWGLGTSKYFERLIGDLQGVNSQPKAVSWVNKYAQATLSVNAGVTLKQAASYPTAGAVLGYKPLIKAFSESVTAEDKKIIDKYTPLLHYRSQGYTTSELGDYTNGTSEDWTKKGKMPYLMGWIQKMDVATTTKLWKAAEFYVRDNYKSLEKGSDAYYKQVAKVYNRVIELTQPNYTTMQRPDILRKASSNPLIKSVTMFKTQPMQNFNLIYDAYGEFRARYAENKENPTAESKADLKSALRKLGLVISSQVLAAIVLNAFDGVGKYLKGQWQKHYGGESDSDDSEVTVKSALSAYAQDSLSTLAGNVWFGSEGATLLLNTLNQFGIGRGATWYDLEMPELDMVNNIVDDVQSVNKMIADKKYNPWYMTKKINKSALAVGTLLGVPAKNVESLVKGIYKDITDITKSGNIFDELDTWSEDSTSRNINASFGDWQKYNEFYNQTVEDMQSGKITKKNGEKYSENGIKQAARKRANEEFADLFTEKGSGE